MKIEVLGMGCAKCNDLLEAVKAAVQQLNVEAEIVKVDNIKDIMAYGVMKTPALVIDGVVKVSGRVPNKDEVAAIIKG